MSTSFDSGNINASNAPSSFPSGVSWYSTNDENGFPADYGALCVIKGSANTGTTQEFHTSGRIFVRHSGANVWGDWYEFDRTQVV